MNLVLDEAEEVYTKATRTKQAGERVTLGRYFVKFFISPALGLCDDWEMVADMLSRT